MTYVVSRPGESAESLIKRFRKRVTKDRIMSEVKKRRYFVTKGEQKRIEKRKGIRKARQRRRKNARRNRNW
jgi:small subunit ribosomal protein S21